MLALYVTDPWPEFYARGMKTWEIRSYPIRYRGDVLIVSSKTHTVVCRMTLRDIVPLTKELWEMNFDKHRTSCSYEDLPYRKKTGMAYAWILSDPVAYDRQIHIARDGRKPYHEVDDSVVAGVPFHPIVFHAERLACKFIGGTMLIYWLKRKYFALVCITDLATGKSRLVRNEVRPEEEESIVRQLVVQSDDR